MNDSGRMRDYAEKRDFIRMQVNAKIDLKIYPTGESKTAVCKDLSGMGMLLQLDAPLAIDTEVETALPSNSPDFPTFRTTARVVRCDQAEGAYLIGLAIVKIEE